MHVHGLIAGLQGTINTASQRSSLLTSTCGKTDNAQYVAISQRPKEGCMLTIATKQAQFVGFCATVAIRGLVLCAKTPKFSPKHSVI